MGKPVGRSVQGASAPLRVYVHGAGKVGRALATWARQAGHSVLLRSARKGLPRRIDAELVVLAVRDGQVADTARALADAGIVPRRSVVVHVAGALGADVLDTLRAHCAGVGQMHPLLAFAGRPEPKGTAARPSMILSGDAAAVRRAGTFARSVGFAARTYPKLDPTAYHAAAALVANGAVGLVAAGIDVLVAAGVPRAQAPLLLGPLLASVAENVSALGMPRALTGPVRRGDAATVQRHSDALQRAAPRALPLYIACVRAQLSTARALGEASERDYDAMDRWAAGLAPQTGVPKPGKESAP
jgi:predicted short-subunit dehydrogenase-like oxidoreductase (DUF2520 family)